MKTSFDKIYLDHHDFQSFCLLGIREGLIKKDWTGKKLDRQFISDRKIINKKNILFYITLFSNIDSDCSIYNLDSFVNQGIISGDSRMLLENDYDPLMIEKENSTEYKSLTKEKKEVFLFSKNVASQIISLNSDRISSLQLSNYKFERPFSINRDYIPSKKEVNSAIKILLKEL